MASFQFPQFEHEIFWKYFSRFNDFCAQLNFSFEKWELCQVIYEGLNTEFRDHVQSMYPGGFWALFSKSPDEVWDFFEYLAHETWEYEQACATYFFPDFHDLHACVAPIVCCYCQSCDHEVNSCPEFYANLEYMLEKRSSELTKLANMIEIVEEQQCRLAYMIREYNEHKTNLSLGSPILTICPYEDCESSLPSESDLHDDIPLTNQKEVVDSPSTLSTFAHIPEPNPPRDTVEDTFIYKSCEKEIDDLDPISLESNDSIPIDFHDLHSFYPSPYLIDDCLGNSFKYHTLESPVFEILDFEFDKTLVHTEFVKLDGFEYVQIFPDWAIQFDKLKRASNCVALILWMYSIWFKLSFSYDDLLRESSSSVFDKLLRALTCFDVEWQF